MKYILLIIFGVLIYLISFCQVTDSPLYIKYKIQNFENNCLELQLSIINRFDSLLYISLIKDKDYEQGFVKIDSIIGDSLFINLFPICTDSLLISYTSDNGIILGKMFNAIKLKKRKRIYLKIFGIEQVPKHLFVKIIYSKGTIYKEKNIIIKGNAP